MSYKGIPKKEDFQPLFASDWNLVVDALDELYQNKLSLEEGLTLGTGDFYVHELTVGDDLDVYGQIFSEGKKVLRDTDPIYIAGFIQRGYQDIQYIKDQLAGIKSTLIEVYYLDQTIEGKLEDIYKTIYEIEKTAKSIEQKTEEIRLYASPRALESLVLDVGTTPKPIKTTSTRVKKIKLYVTQDTTYVVYIGDQTSQDFPVEPGEKEEIEIDDASKVYLLSENISYVRILLEKV